MRYAIRSLVLLLFMMSVGVVSATENNELVDAIDGLSTPTEDNLRFQTFSSCEDMSDVLTDFVKEHFDRRQGGRGGGRGGPMPLMMNDAVMVREDVAMESDKSAVSPAGSPQPSSSTDFSTTNIQVVGVDEPEILKSDGDYLYYYNMRVQKVFVIQSPLNRTTSMVDLLTTRIVAIINVPSTFSQIQLFVRPNQLILLGQRRTNQTTPTLIDKTSRTDIVVYNTSDKTNPKLVKFSDLDGMYQDARLIGNKLFVVSQLGVNRRRFPQTVKNVDDVVIDAEDILPKAVDIAYTIIADKQNLKISDKAFPYQVTVQRPDCRDMYYVLPTKESIDQYGLTPQFTVVRAINLDEVTDAMTTTTAFGSTQTMHLTDKSVYLANNFRLPGGSVCPPRARCIWWGGGEEKTLLHKFSIQGTKLAYVDSTLLPGSPLTQWSLSEDTVGNFRMLTRTRSPQLATHFIALDPALNELGTLMNIEPGEEFKASRFIGDKLYLVTFEQIDPLFVIDLADLKNPMIVGELKIPGFSTYLHPYSVATNGVQQLIGVGYDTEINQWGGTVTNGVKIDLYTVDYTKQDDAGNVAVSQTATATFGGKGSDSEVLQNPRLFVWNESKKQLIMPMVLQTASIGKQCSIVYDADGKVAQQECRDNETYKTTFAGTKILSVLPDKISEAHSYDFKDLLKQDKQAYGDRQGEIWPWQFSQQQFRVGYLGDVVYTLSNMFGHFALPVSNQEVYLEFDPTVDVP